MRHNYYYYIMVWQLHAVSSTYTAPCSPWTSYDTHIYYMCWRCGLYYSTVICTYGFMKSLCCALILFTRQLHVHGTGASACTLVHANKQLIYSARMSPEATQDFNIILYRGLNTRRFALTLYQPMTHRCVVTFVNSP